MKQATANRPKKARRSARKRKGRVDFRKLRTIPILKCGEELITIAKALRRARQNPLTNHGKRIAMNLADDLNAGRVLCKNWRVWQYVIFAKDSWRGGNSYAWYVIHRWGGFICLGRYFTYGVGSDGRLLRLG